jgi:cytidyltransferase-like protein
MEIQYCKDMTSIYEYKKNCPDLYWFLKHFLYKDDEVLYFVGNGELKAVVSIGDLFRCLEGKKKVILNTNFTWVREKENEKAFAFFLEHSTVHELPIVDDSGRFVGVIKSGEYNSTKTWNRFRLYAKGLYYSEEAFYMKTAKKFMEHFKGIVLLADLPNDDLVVKHLKSDKEKEDYIKKGEINPLMQLGEMTDQEERTYWGDTIYEQGISKKFVEEFAEMKITDKNGIKYYENSNVSHYITFENGKRKVPNKNENAKRKIYLVGPCTIFGAYVADNQTIEYYLQQFINDSTYEWQVVNFGALSLGYEFQYLLTESIANADIVLIAFPNRRWTLSFLERYQSVHYIGDFSDIFDNIHNPISCILDSFRHINYRASEKIAERIYASVKPYLGQESSIKERDYFKSPIQNYFIAWDIYVYYKDFALQYNLGDLEGTVGAIVMNCNPFTKGHRYLAEYAAAKTDTLIVFVVEEDASAFSFADRIEMVKKGTQDIDNIIVVPSGKYSISKSTFAQYFEKDKTINQIDSMEYDVRIFGEVIAECMNISCRFVGEEPTDLVTRQYNQTMKEILPQYGIQLEEIPRLKRDVEYISASKAREYITIGNWEKAEDILPETTINHLKNHVYNRSIKEAEI